MKILFVGPSLPDAHEHCSSDIVLMPPAAQGDVFRAIENGAGMIGLIDGFFENVASVWHKEILYALSRGIPVLGAASMGALRAAECAAYGMVGIGKIFQRFQSQVSLDDADVAQIHGPAETGYLALSEPLVNIVFTLASLTDDETLSSKEAEALLCCAKDIYFKDRTWRRIIAAANLTSWSKEGLIDLIKARKINQKRLDALELLTAFSATGAIDLRKQDWTFHKTSHWRGTGSSS